MNKNLKVKTEPKMAATEINQDGNSGLGKTSHIRKEEHGEKDTEATAWLLNNQKNSGSSCGFTEEQNSTDWY
jgi:hypothetical protein